MFEIGERVVYGIHGVCCVAGTEEKSADRKAMTYLVLEPVDKGGSRFLVPTHNSAAMGKLRRISTKDELETLIHSQAVRTGEWIQNENERKQTCRKLIGSGDREGIMRMMHTLYVHRAVQLDAGRKSHLCDENFLRDAEKLLAGEFSLVMGMEPTEARQYIRDTLCP